MELRKETRQCYAVRLHPSLELLSNTPRRIVSAEGFSMGKKKYGPILFGENEGENQKTPLCIILGWFAAKRRHIMKFVNVYLDQDFDVLLVSSPPSGFINPMGSLKLRSKLLVKFHKHNRDTYEQIFVHGFSGGAFVWGLFLCHVNKDRRDFEWTQSKIKGQLWDSQFLEPGRISAVGSSILFPDSRVVQKLSSAYGLTIMTVLDNPSVRVAEAFRYNNFKCPYLVVGSEEDNVAPPSSLAACASYWQETGSTVFWKMWKTSPHVCHMKENSEEYVTLWKEFLIQVGLLKYPGKFQIATEIKNRIQSSAF